MNAMSESTPLYYLSISRASALIRDRELTAVDLTEAHLRRIAAVDERLHAFITVTADHARESANAADREIAAGRYRGPLHGIPIAHKDIVSTKGVRTTAHSRLLEHWIPHEDATVYTRLEQAGAISLGKTALAEFAYGVTDETSPFPAACNPWSLEHAPGSSSSGSGAAVAAGLCMAAIGTDTGGSIRHPAAVCALVGMKPTFGLVSTYGVLPLAPSLDHPGPMTRTVRDNAIMLGAMAGFDARDRHSVRSEPKNYEALIGRELRGLRVGVPRRFLEQHPAEPVVAEAFERALAALRDLGARIEDIEPEGIAESIDAANVIITYEAYQYHRRDFEVQPEKFGASFRERILGSRRGEADYRAAIAYQGRLRETFRSVFASGIDVVVTPGREHPPDTLEAVLAGRMKRPASHRMFNLTGTPALVLPMGFTVDGLPLGLQIAAAHFREDLIYQVAAAYEEAAGWCNRHPAV
jgi:aspartyl-tRNA(Asn)/glutamyl-tRNA(Gln) amidotransferase subunit A